MMLIWDIVKKNNAFLVESNDYVFSKDHHNLTNLNSYKYCGLSNPKAIGVNAGRDNKGVVVAVHRKNAINKPAKHAAHTYIKHAGVRRIAKTVKGITQLGYRKDLEAAALARVSAIVKSQKAKVDTPKPKKLRGKKAALSA